MKDAHKQPAGTPGPAETSSLGSPETPRAARLSKLALVVAAVVMSATLLVVALMVTSGPPPASKSPPVVMPAGPRTGPAFMSGPEGRPPYVPGPGADSTGRRPRPQALPGGEEAEREVYVPPAYRERPAYYGLGAASGAEGPSEQEQAFRRALRAELAPQGITRHAPRPAAQEASHAGGAADGAPWPGAYPRAFARPDPASAEAGAAAPGSAIASSGGYAAEASPAARYLATGARYPRSPHEIREGTVIEAYLVTGIHSDLPGDVVAQVARNIFDSHTQQVVLIPRGTRLIGTYDNQVALDQRRILVAWTRMVLPDGRSIALPGLRATDGGGRAGLEGTVHRHQWRAFGNALMLSVVGAGLTLSASRGSYYGGGYGYPGPGDIAASSVATELSRVATELLRRDLHRRPTITIREGTAFHVFISGDLALEPYEPYDRFLVSPGSGRRGSPVPRHAAAAAAP